MLSLQSEPHLESLARCIFTILTQYYKTKGAAKLFLKSAQKGEKQKKGYMYVHIYLLGDYDEMLSPNANEISC